jgi:RNase H-fold protein (predicted Holliday junction resolvase)
MAKRAIAPAGRGYPSLEEVRGCPVPKIAGTKGGKVVTILAMDLSTSCIGWALGMDRKLALYGKFVFKKDASIGAKLSIFREYLEVLLDIYEPDRVLVEKPMSGRGTTTARHYELLGVVREALFSNLNKDFLDSWIISAKTVKGLMRVKPTGDHDLNKVAMCNKINELYGFDLVFDKNSKIKSGDDIADAIAVLTAYYRRGTKE